LAPLLDREDCHFISVQHGEVEAEVVTFNATRSRQLVCFSNQEINDFEDLASLIGALDCVISVDNTNVHLSGALGKPCLAMLPFKAQWRYGATGASLPWYSSVKLIRQQKPRQWNEVIHGVNAAISDVLGRVRPEQ
jgi:ADP-heptose:LPS heptosyltransferase